MENIQIISTGSYLPKQKVTNATLAEKLGITEDYIVKRTGILERYYSKEETIVDLAVYAAKDALKKVKENIKIDEIIVATTSSKELMPSISFQVKRKIAEVTTRECICQDILSGCAGYINALDIARNTIVASEGRVKTALIIGVEKLSEFLEESDIGTSIILSDGAGATIIAKTEEKKDYKILFLDAQDDVLIRRYRETRRNHPLAAVVSGSVEQAIDKERERLKPIRARADYIIDTSYLSNAQLKEQISSLFLEDSSEALLVNCMSFGFKYGIPTEADLMFDVRCFPNPFYVDRLRPKNGLDQEIQNFVMQDESSQKFAEKLFDMVDFLLPLYCNEGKSQLVVAVGCTGGKHRSVTFAQRLYEHLLGKGVRVRVQHRDISKA